MKNPLAPYHPWLALFGIMAVWQSGFDVAAVLVLQWDGLAVLAI